MPREYGRLILSKASKKPLQFIHHAAEGKSFCQMKGKCTVSKKDLFLGGHFITLQHSVKLKL